MQDVLWQPCSLFRAEPCSRQFRLFFSKPSVTMFKTRPLMEDVCQLIIRQSCSRHLYCYYFNHFPVILLFLSSFIPAIVHHLGTWSFGKYTCSPKAEDMIFPIQMVQKGVLEGCNYSLWTWSILDTRHSAEFSWRGGMQVLPWAMLPQALQSAPAACLSSRVRLELLCFCSCLWLPCSWQCTAVINIRFS